MNIPFARWDTDRVMSWMHDIGLNMYVADCRRWVKNGEQLLRASPHDLEKVGHTQVIWAAMVCPDLASSQERS